MNTLTAASNASIAILSPTEITVWAGAHRSMCVAMPTPAATTTGVSHGRPRPTTSITTASGARDPARLHEDELASRWSIRKACGSLHLSRAKASLGGSAGQRRTGIRSPVPCRDRQKPRLHRKRPVGWHLRFASLQLKSTYRNLIELRPLLQQDGHNRPRNQDHPVRRIRIDLLPCASQRSPEYGARVPSGSAAAAWPARRSRRISRRSASAACPGRTSSAWTNLARSAGEACRFAHQTTGERQSPAVSSAARSISSDRYSARPGLSRRS